MKKINTIIEAPIFTRSGYGDQAEALAHCFLKNPRLDVKLVPIPWGSCQPKNTGCDPVLEKLVVRQVKDIPRPELFVSITLPQLSGVAGTRCNMNFSAGVEVSFAKDEMIQGLNKHNVNVTYSNFSRQVFLNSKVKLEKPCEVIGWSQDYVSPVVSKGIDDQLSKITEKECFLFIGQITNNNLFADRKDTGGMLRTFFETFAGKENKPGLIMKSSGVNFSTFDRNNLIEKLQYIKSLVNSKDLPNVYLLHGELTESEMNYLQHHEKVCAHLSFTHGEGWGHPLFMGSMTGKPVICPAWSAQVDYLTKDNTNLFIPIPGKQVVIPDQCASEYFPKGSEWFQADYKAASQTLSNFFYGDRAEALDKSKEVAILNKDRFNMSKMIYRVNKLVDKYVK